MCSFLVLILDAIQISLPGDRESGSSSESTASVHHRTDPSVQLPSATAVLALASFVRAISIHRVGDNGAGEGAGGGWPPCVKGKNLTSSSM